MKLKVLTLWQPWATLLAYGLKRYETRPKPTTHKGIYLIHAAKVMNKLCKEICYTDFFAEALHSIGITDYRDLPCGSIVGAYSQYACKKISKYPSGRPDVFNPSFLSPQEFAFGDYSDGRYVWFGKNHKVIENPVEYKNGQGYYLNYKGDIEAVRELITESTNLFN